MTSFPEEFCENEFDKDQCLSAYKKCSRFQKDIFSGKADYSLFKKYEVDQFVFTKTIEKKPKRIEVPLFVRDQLRIIQHAYLLQKNNKDPDKIHPAWVYAAKIIDEIQEEAERSLNERKAAKEGWMNYFFSFFSKKTRTPAAPANLNLQKN